MEIGVLIDEVDGRKGVLFTAQESPTKERAVSGCPSLLLLMQQVQQRGQCRRSSKLCDPRVKELFQRF